jgi:MFS family permease
VPALRHRNFRLFLGGMLVSFVGTWMQTIGQAWLVLILTRDPFVLGLVTAAQGLPIVVLGLFGGVIADRAPKRAVILVCQSTMLALAAVLAGLCLTGVIEVWHVILLAFALGAVNAIDLPARQAFVVEMVGPTDTASAVGLHSSAYSGARLVGPAVAGLVIAAATSWLGDGVRASGVAFAANAVSYLFVLVAVAAIREDELFLSVRPAVPRGLRTAFRQIADGLAYLRGARPVLATLVVPGLIATIAVNFGVLVPVLAVEEFGMDSSGLGLLLAAAGVGGLLSALRIGVGGRAGPRVLIGGALVLGVAEVATGLVGVPLASAVALFLAGAGAVAMRTAANTNIQLATPQHLRGRVMSVFSIVFEGSSPMGGLLAGALAASLGVRLAFVITGVGAVLVAVLGASAVARIGRPADATDR